MLRRNRGGSGRFAVSGSRGAVVVPGGIGSAGKPARCLETRGLQRRRIFTRHHYICSMSRSPGKAERSGHELFPVILGLADELGTGLAVASDECIEEAIDLSLESLLEGHQGSKTTRFVTGRGVAFLCEPEEECLDGVALQAREPLLQLIDGARPRTTEAGEHLPFAG